MNRLVAGVASGLLATAVLSLLMVMKSAMGLMPELDVIAMLAAMMGASVAMSWMAHFAIGAVWGGLFASAARALPGSACWVRGMLFSIAPWLLMMVALMPMAGAGMFGLSLGIMAPIMTLMLHLVFGAVLGLAFAKFARPEHWSHDKARAT
jgi:hypothetical protein